ncbi:MAG: hypothetical protein JSV86_16290 [Gemmatimonadota bacterium]|nr:MAG: hypothetical protein JSV86_16290 [Gemmatimonadota bacterium]
MSIIQIMVTIIIVTILVTVILGVASYAAYWLRRGRRPAEPVEVDTSPRFFYRYSANGDQQIAGAADESDAGPRQIDSPLPLRQRSVAGFTPVTEGGNGGTGR